MKKKRESYKFEITPVSALAEKVRGGGQAVKRDGRIVPFDKTPITEAIEAANCECGGPLSHRAVLDIAQDIENRSRNLCRPAGIEEIQDMVVEDLGKLSPAVAEAYQSYRLSSAKLREAERINDQYEALLKGENEELNTENANKNPKKINAVNSYMGDTGNKAFQELDAISRSDRTLVSCLAQHAAGIIHINDFAQWGMRMHNCGLGNLEDIFRNGTVINGIHIEPVQRLRSAASITAQVIGQVRSCQYGGFTFSLSAFAYLVDKTRQEIRRELEADFPGMDVEAAVEKRLAREIKDSMQSLYYDINTLMDTGGQIPFVTMHMDTTEVADGQEKEDLALLISEVLKQRKAGVRNEKGLRTITTFPKLVFVTSEDNIEDDAPYHYLLEEAATCTASAMTPDFISAKISREMKDGQVIPVMGCRSALNPYVDEDGNPVKYGRFNQGVCTLNLPDIALSSGGDFDVFWELFEMRMETVHQVLKMRHETLEGTKAKTAPILWQHGVYARLDADDVIDPLLHGGYSTISAGYAGLAETVQYMTGKSHTQEGGREFGMEIMEKMNEFCDKWKEEEDLLYSVYGTPIESTTDKFASCLKARFGEIEGITDKGYVTNSYHVPVTEEIDAFDKLAVEAPFQKLSKGGSITYIETPDMSGNIEALISLIHYMHDHNYYAEFNMRIDLCLECGYRGEHEVVYDADGTGHFRCPNCGNTDPEKQDITRRICGYLAKFSQGWNKGRLAEIAARVLHI